MNGKIVNRRELSEILGKTPKTLTDWQKEGLPVKVIRTSGKGNDYETGEVIKWLIERELSKIVQQSGGDIKTFTEEKTRLTKNQADKVENENKLMNRELIHTDEIFREWGKLLTDFKVGILGIPNKMAPKLEMKSKAVIKKKLDEALKKILTELSGYDGVNK